MASADVDAEDLEDPFANLMPSDLNPAKKVNRRRAKPIPKELLHHNNLSLLRRYVTPGGQIMNRIQSRLGAKDQRKVAKLVKRARHLGLIPVLGQWKFEDRGSVKDPSIYEDKEWELKLIERGLIERKSSVWEVKRQELASKVSSSSSTNGKVLSGW
jgi:small subunit ribosomal protein S18